MFILILLSFNILIQTANNLIIELLFLLLLLLVLLLLVLAVLVVLVLLVLVLTFFCIFSYLIDKFFLKLFITYFNVSSSKLILLSLLHGISDI
ncbi:hypothetical protein DWZ11_00805 [Megamonas rupellensis]|uniref:Uncharacterized protein n=1 Tax=Megamonas rupellensis TaxID=491921 RepID=A0A412A014_9FIRM|nr:hypothetical protein DWZ11_00805 [Megamonas rupellensis]